MNRNFFVWLHRWAGLVMAGFLILVGVTGSLLAIWSDLDLPATLRQPRPGVTQRLDLATRRARAGIGSAMPGVPHRNIV